MAVETTATSATFVGTGASSSYAPGFYVNSSNQVRVFVDDVLQVLGVDYVVNGVGASLGCTIVGSFPLGSVVYIKRATPITQLVDTENNETILEDVLDGALDKLTMIAQEQATQLAGAFRVKPGQQIDPINIEAFVGNVVGVGPDRQLIPVAAGTGNDPALRSDLASNAAGKGAAIIAVEGGGSLQAAIEGNLGFKGTSATKVSQTLAVHIRECEVRVTQEGATGSGSGNDATGINNAIAEAELIAAAKGGCDVVFPSGNYRITAGLRVRQGRVNLVFRGGAQLVPVGSFDTLRFESAAAATFLYFNHLVDANFDETGKTGGKALVGKYLAEASFQLTAAGGFDGIQLDTFNTIDLDARVTNLTGASAVYCLVRGGGSVGARSDVLRIHKLVMGGNYVDGQKGLGIDGFVHTVVGKSVYGVNIGGRVLETANSIGAADVPAFLNFWDFQTDFQKGEGIYLGEGQIAEFQGAIVNGSRTSDNIFVGANFKDARFIGGRSTGAARSGIAIAGVDTLVSGVTAKFNSSNQFTGTLGALPGILVGGSSRGTRVSGCRSGDPGTSTYQANGLQIDTGADSFIVQLNDVRNNVASGVVNGAGTGPTKIVGNNIG